MAQDVHSLAGPYALHALSDSERLWFEQHLAECETCALEVRGLRETTARLGSAAARPAPPALFDRVFAEIAHVRQLPPEAPASPAVPQPPMPPVAARPAPPAGRHAEPAPEFEPDEWSPAEGLRSSGRRGSRGSRGGQGRGGPGRTGPGRTGPGRNGPGRTGRRRATRLIMPTVAAACLAVAVALGFTNVRTQERVDQAQRRAEQAETARRELSGVLAAPDVRAVKRPVNGGGNGTIVVSRRQSKAVVVMSGLSALPSSKTYELWLLGAGQPQPAGLMRPNAGDGTLTPIVVDGLGNSTQVGITVEPASGSTAPTTTPIFTAPLSGRG